MNIFHYTLVFVFFLLVASDLSRERKAKFILSVIAVSLYSLLVAFKGVSGSDTFTYYKAYINFSDNYSDFKNYSGFKEPGFWLINYLTSKAGFSFEWLNFLNSIIIFFSLLTVVKRVGVIALLIYIPFVGLNVDFSTMRFSFSLHLFIILYYHTGRPLFSTVFSGLFHGFGFLFFVPAMFKEYDFSKIKWYKLLGIFLVLLAGSIYIYLEFVERYLNNGSQFIVRDGFGFLLQSGLLCVVCILARLNRKDSFIIVFLSTIPVGFRVVGVFLLLSNFYTPKYSLNLVVFYILIAFMFFAKLYSFSSASLSIDGERSIILFYSGFFI